MSREEIINKIEDLRSQLHEIDEDEDFYVETRKEAKRMKATLDIYCKETGLSKEELIQLIAVCNGGTIINNNLEKEGK